MLGSMTDTGAHPTSEPSGGTAPRPTEHPASFARHDVDVNAPDDARGGHEEASFDRHDVDPDAPDSVSEHEQATFDREDVDPDAPDAVVEVNAATFDRHDGE
jgi:hypothetical protein